MTLIEPATGWSSVRDAEHAVAGLDREVTLAATHFASSTSTVLVTIEVDGEVDGAVEVLGAASQGDADRVRQLHAGRRGGRLFAFPGAERLVGTMTVGELLAVSAVEQVVMIGAREPVAAEQPIDTQGYVRPDFADGVVRLVVRPAAGGLVIPFEQPHPTPCCADH